MIAVVITPETLPPLFPEWQRTDIGAELVFHGIVRDEEQGRPIRALYYEHYAGMAERQLERLAAEAAAIFDLDYLVCIHRVGEIAAGEASLRVVMRARHRAAALEAMAWFISALKRDVPIWKWGVAPDGTRFPSSGAGA